MTPRSAARSGVKNDGMPRMIVVIVPGAPFRPSQSNGLGAGVRCSTSLQNVSSRCAGSLFVSPGIDGWLLGGSAPALTVRPFLEQQSRQPTSRALQRMLTFWSHARRVLANSLAALKEPAC
ncbi:MAG: hypothetical protein ACXWJA_00460 [Caldimonas sp.]